MKKLILGLSLLSLSSGVFSSTLVCEKIKIDDKERGFITIPAPYKVMIETMERTDKNVKESDYVLYQIEQNGDSIVRKAYLKNALTKEHKQASLRRLDDMGIKIVDQINDVKVTLDLDIYDLTLYQKISNKEGVQRLEFHCSEHVLKSLKF